jgi:RND family efflux transporter MFP subunit
VEVQSQITGDENVLATPQMSGTVTSISVRPGQRVSKGQVLATLDAAAVDQQIKAQDAQLGFARTVYEKQQRLWAQQIGTEIQLLQAKSNYEAMQKQRAALVAQRNMYRILSPISGTVDAVDIKVGDIAMPGGAGTMGIRIVNNNKLKAEANLGENYLGKVKTGDDVTLLLPDLNDSIKTKLTYVAQAVDPVSRAFTVQVRMGSNSRLHPNMSCRMRITNYTSANTISVPVSLIQKTGQGDMLYVVEGNKAKAVFITLGRTSNGRAEVLSGLKPGDRVITEGYMDLDNGEPVEVRK